MREYYKHKKVSYDNCDEDCGMTPMPKLGLAEAYIKDQPYVGMVPLQEGFHRGSMFPNLYKPYEKKPKYIC